MLELEWEDIAQNDLLSIVVYIAADNPHAALALKGEIEKRVAGLRKQPRMYKIGRVEGTRGNRRAVQLYCGLQGRRLYGVCPSRASCRKAGSVR